MSLEIILLVYVPGSAAVATVVDLVGELDEEWPDLPSAYLTFAA